MGGDLVKRLVARDGAVFDKWDPVVAEVWVRAEFKCEYCDKDMLRDRETYRSGEVDHIVPKSKGGAGASLSVHFALACRHCNWLKRNKLLGGEELRRRVLGGDVKARAELVAIHRAHIAVKRAAYEEKMVGLRQIVRPNGPSDE